METSLNVNGVIIDYKILGKFPEKMKEANDKDLLNYFIDSYKFTFISTAFEHYGNLTEIKELIKDNLILDETDYYKQTNSRKWNILLLVVLKMFYQMHNTTFANTTIDLIIQNIDSFTDEQLLKTINDMNFALYYGIEECIIVTPSKINELGATNDDCFLLSELLDEKDSIIKFLKTKIKKEDINRERFFDLFGESPVRNFHEMLYDGFVLSWIDIMEMPSKLTISSFSQWESFLAKIYAISYTFFSLPISNKMVSSKVTNNIYEHIASIVKTKYEIGFQIPPISM